VNAERIKKTSEISREERKQMRRGDLRREWRQKCGERTLMR
jgi:hypothetical protein